jgi:hypothetical protein
VPQRYLPSGKNSDNTISSLSWAPWRHFRPTVNCRLENVDVQREKICWRFGSRTLNRYRSLISISLVSVWEAKFVLFNSMLKYVINRLMHDFFYIRTVIIPRPISTLGAKALWPISVFRDEYSLDIEKGMH